MEHKKYQESVYDESEDKESSNKSQEEYEIREESVHEDQKNEDDPEDNLEYDLEAAPIRNIQTSIQTSLPTVIQVKNKKNTKEDTELEEIKEGIKNLTPKYYKNIFIKTNAIENLQMFTKQIENIIKNTADGKLDKSVAGFLICANMDVSRYQRVDYLVYLNKFANLSDKQKQKCTEVYQQFIDLLSKDKEDTEHEHFKNVSMLVQCISHFQQRMIDLNRKAIKDKLNYNLYKYVKENNLLFKDVTKIYKRTMELRGEIFENLNKNIDNYIDNPETIKKNVYYPLYLLFNNISTEMFDAPEALKNDNQEDTNYVKALKHMLANGMSDEKTFYEILSRIDKKTLKTLTNIGELKKKFSKTSDQDLNWASFCDLITIISKEYMKQKIETTIGKREITDDEALKFCRDNGISTKLVPTVKTCLEYQMPHHRILNSYKTFLDKIKAKASKKHQFILSDDNIIFEMISMSPVSENNLLQNVVKKKNPWVDYYFDPIGLAQTQRELLIEKRNRLSRWHLLRRHGLQKKIDFLDRELGKVHPDLRTQEARNKLKSQQIANSAPRRQLPPSETNTNQQPLNNNFIYNDRANRDINNFDIQSNLLRANSYKEYIDNINLTGCCSSYAY